MPRGHDKTQDVHVEREEDDDGKRERKRSRTRNRQQPEISSGEELIEALQDLADGVHNLADAIEGMNEYCEDAGPVAHGMTHPLAAIGNAIGQVIQQLGGKSRR